MTYPGALSEIVKLGQYATTTVANPQAAIAIRDENSVYLWVNDAWVNISGASREVTVGKRLDQLTIVPHDQVDRFIAEDRLTVQQRRLVKINVYTVHGAPIRFMTVRTYVVRKGVGYIIEVSFILGPLITSAILGWSSERLERAFGEDLAGNLLAEA